MPKEIQSGPKFFKLFDEFADQIVPIVEQFQKKHDLCEKSMRALIKELTICNIAIPDKELKLTH